MTVAKAHAKKVSSPEIISQVLDRIDAKIEEALGGRPNKPLPYFSVVVREACADVGYVNHYLIEAWITGKKLGELLNVKNKSLRERAEKITKRFQEAYKLSRIPPGEGYEEKGKPDKTEERLKKLRKFYHPEQAPEE